jgi:hypothetical protein
LLPCYADYVEVYGQDKPEKEQSQVSELERMLQTSNQEQEIMTDLKKDLQKKLKQVSAC